MNISSDASTWSFPVPSSHSVKGHMPHLVARLAYLGSVKEGRVCVWSWQNVVLEAPIVAGTNTEAVFSAWSGVYASTCEQIWSDLASQLYVVEKKYPWTSNPGCYVVSQFSLKTISPSGSTLRHSWDNAGYGTLCPIQPVGSLETFIFLHIKNKCLIEFFSSVLCVFSGCEES